MRLAQQAILPVLSFLVCGAAFADQAASTTIGKALPSQLCARTDDSVSIVNRGFAESETWTLDCLNEKSIRIYSEDKRGTLRLKEVISKDEPKSRFFRDPIGEI